MNRFGVEMREARTKAGLTLRHVASVLGVSVPFLSDVEHGRRKPLRRELIDKLVAIVGSKEALLKAAALDRGTVCPHCGKGLVL